LRPITGVVFLISGLREFGDFDAAGYGGFWALVLISCLGLLVLTIYAAVRFFHKRRNAPSVIIILLVASIYASGLLLEFASPAGELQMGFVADVILAAIGIPYFTRSRRVSATFVN
jgi:hypothetical protein